MPFGTSHVARTASGLAFVREVRLPDGTRMRALVVGGVFQSATYLGERRNELPFAYLRSLERVFELGVPVRDVLLLGGGGYAYPKYLITHHPETSVDVVEIDPAITRIARRWFYLDRLIAETNCVRDGRLGLVDADGRAYLEQGGKAYDVVINDTFRGRVPARELATLEAASAVRSRLRPGGIYLANVVSHQGGQDLGFLRDVTATLDEAFGHVHVIPATDETFRGEDNYLVIATDGDYAFSDDLGVYEGFLGNALHDEG
jgi:spermidine synthase